MEKFAHLSLWDMTQLRHMSFATTRRWIARWPNSKTTENFREILDEIRAEIQRRTR